MDTIEIPVGSLRFDARAAGPPDGTLVLLLHGFPQTSYAYRHQLAALAEAGYRAVAPDQRGYSSGARPGGVEAYRVEELVGDVLGMADELGAERFHLVGHDWGAAVAWHVAGRHPDRLRSLTALSVPHPAAFAAALADPDGDQTRRSAYIGFFRSEGSEHALLADDAAGLRNLFAATGLSELDAQEYLAVLTEPATLTAALNWYRAVDLAAADGVGAVATPTLFVWSDDDPALGPHGAHATAQHVAGPYRFEVLHGVSHWIPEQAPERLNDLLLDHLAAHP